MAENRPVSKAVSVEVESSDKKKQSSRVLGMLFGVIIAIPYDFSTYCQSVQECAVKISLQQLPHF